MDAKLNRDGSMLLLTLQGDLNLECAAELRSLLQEVLHPGQDVTLDLSGARSTDLSFWQIVAGAGQTARARGYGLVVNSGLPQGVLQFLEKAGLTGSDQLDIDWEERDHGQEDHDRGRLGQRAPDGGLHAQRRRVRDHRGR